MSAKFKDLYHILTHPVTAILSMMLGFYIGLHFKTLAFYLAPLGNSYLSLLVMCIVPVLFASIIYGLASLLKDPGMHKKIRGIFIVFILGVFLVSVVGVLAGLIW